MATKFKQMNGSYAKAMNKPFKNNYYIEKYESPTIYGNFLLSEKEKTDKDQVVIKKKFRWYKRLGMNQVNTKSEEIQRLEDLANGVINRNDFIKSNEVQELQFIDPSIKFEENDVELEFFPIAPNIINYLEGEIDKKYISFTANAINPEVTNSILEMRNKEIREKLGEFLTAQFEGVPQDPNQVRDEINKKLDEFKTYRHEIEEWSNIMINLENDKFNMSNISRRLFRELLVHEEPYVHVKLVDNYYYPEILETKNCFYLKSKKVQDASDYTMFGWFQYENFATVLNKYSLSAEDVEKVTSWATVMQEGFAFDHQHLMDGGPQPVQASYNNYRMFQQMNWSDGTNDPVNRLLRITNIYWLEPKKIGVLTVNLNGELSTIKVDDSFKVTKKPKYKFNKKLREDLIEGEHVEWTYINELYHGVEISPDWSAGTVEAQEWDRNVFINLGAHPVQYSHKSLRYGIKIPVHGGSVQGWSVTGRMYSWQKFYNYLGNRCKQLLYTELGKFLLMNQNVIPDTTKGGSIGEQGLLKFFIQAKELSLGMTDHSATSMGTVAGQGVGQVVDLTKTQEVGEKMQLMRMIKQECYDSIGLNLGNLQEKSPYMSATAVNQGAQTTTTQLQNLYSRFIDIMRLTRETMLETALYLTSKGEYRELNYVTSDSQRIIFNLEDPNTLLHKLAIYVDNDVKDIFNLEKMKQLVMYDNTMGADSLEKSLMINSTSTSELVGHLKDLVKERDKKQEQERAFQQDMQQKQIDAAEKLKKTELDWKAEQAELDRISELEGKRIAALGYGNSTADEINSEILERQKLVLKEAELQHSFAKTAFDQQLALSTLDAKKENNTNSLISKEQFQAAQLKLREKELEAAKQRTAAMKRK